MEYTLSHHWSTRLEYQWVNDVGGSSTGGTDLNMVNLGVIYHFVSASEIDLPDPTPVVPVSMPTVQVHTEPQWSSNNVSFASNSSQLTTELQQALLPVIQRLQAYSQAQVTIITHADSKGSVESNQKLSERRADAVRNYLIAHGVAQTQIKIICYGETLPLANNTTEAGRHQNRRVELLSPAFEVTNGLGTVENQQ